MQTDETKIDTLNDEIDALQLKINALVRQRSILIDRSDSKFMEECKQGLHATIE